MLFLTLPLLGPTAWPTRKTRVRMFTAKPPGIWAQVESSDLSYPKYSLVTTSFSFHSENVVPRFPRLRFRGALAHLIHWLRWKLLGRRGDPAFINLALCPPLLSCSLILQLCYQPQAGGNSGPRSVITYICKYRTILLFRLLHQGRNLRVGPFLPFGMPYLTRELLAVV